VGYRADDCHGTRQPCPVLASGGDLACPFPGPQTRGERLRGGVAAPRPPTAGVLRRPPGASPGVSA
jgi:hypothetical protein